MKRFPSYRCKPNMACGSRGERKIRELGAVRNGEAFLHQDERLFKHLSLI